MCPKTRPHNAPFWKISKKSNLSNRITVDATMILLRRFDFLDLFDFPFVFWFLKPYPLKWFDFLDFSMLFLIVGQFFLFFQCFLWMFGAISFEMVCFFWFLNAFLEFWKVFFVFLCFSYVFFFKKKWLLYLLCVFVLWFVLFFGWMSLFVLLLWVVGFTACLNKYLNENRKSHPIESH